MLSICLGAFDSVKEAEKAALCHFAKTKQCTFCSPERIAQKEGRLPAVAFRCLKMAHIRLTDEMAFFCCLS